MTKLQLKIYDMPMSEWIRGPMVAKQFLKDHPDKLGIRDGCSYVQNEDYDNALYVYRTKTSVVVRGTKR